MLTITVNSNSLNEKKYVLEQIFTTLLNVDFQLYTDDNLNEIEITKEGKKIKLNSEFFNLVNEKGWLSEATMPKLPLKEMDTCGWLNERFLKTNYGVPILYGTDTVNIFDKTLVVGIDIFGSIFFMLSRYEELVCQKKDSHDRFPFVESIAFKEGFVMRPIVDEYVELLWDCITHLWPEIKKKNHKYKAFISCDVDFIEDDGVRFPGIIKRLGADLFKRKSIKAGLTSLNRFIDVSLKNKVEKDPFNTFDFMMSECEKNNLKMAFYFIPRNNKELIDGNYDIESERVLGLMKDIIKRGHEVGYHGSYNSYDNLERTKEEVDLLRKVYDSAGGNPNDIKGGRQHYLRWQTGVTEQNWVNAGLEYDSTLGYAEHVGFRCGTSQEYEFYDCVNRKPLKLIIRPLVCMEVSMFNKNYMGLIEKDALTTLKVLYNNCRRYDTNFSLLWHNSSLVRSKEKNLFKKIISEIYYEDSLCSTSKYWPL